MPLFWWEGSIFDLLNAGSILMIQELDTLKQFSGSNKGTAGAKLATSLTRLRVPQYSDWPCDWETSGGY